MTDDLSKAVSYVRHLAEQYTEEAKEHILAICDAAAPPSDSLIEVMARAINPDAFNDEIADTVTMEAYQIRRREKAREQARAALTAQRTFKREQAMRREP
jgi:hypothetical protein